MTEAKRHKNPILLDVDRLRIKPFAPRLHPHVPPTTDVCDAPTVCLTVNSEWASHILGALSVLEQPDAWQGTDQEVFDAIQKVRQLMDMLSCGCDNGNDFVLYLKQLTVQQQLITNVYNVNHLLTDIDINAPDTLFDHGQSDSNGDSDFRGHALCLACAAFIEVVAQQIKAYNTGNLNLISVLVAPFGFIGPWGAFIVFLTNSALRVLNEINLRCLDDQDAKDNFACCMADYLAGKANTYINWSSFIDNCYNEGSSFEHDINLCLRTAISITQENWLVFNKVLAEQFRFAQAGIADECPCDDCTIPIHIIEGTATLDDLQNCDYHYILPAGVGEVVKVARVDGLCFRVTNLTWGDNGMTPQIVRCDNDVVEPYLAGNENTEMTVFQIFNGRTFPIDISFRVTE